MSLRKKSAGNEIHLSYDLTEVNEVLPQKTLDQPVTKVTRLLPTCPKFRNVHM